MSTYLPGITDYIPQVQPFAPDLNFYANVLQTKQSRYDAGREKIGTLYGSLLNSPLSRQDNEEKRQQFFKDVDEQIEKISGLDLSLKQNQEYAQGIFNQLLDDKTIVKDMVWTKSWMNQMKKADYLKTCLDPEKCGGKYWEGGVTSLMYKRQEFMNASPEQAMNFESPEFVPMQNIYEKAPKLIKDMGLGIKYDEKDGAYIVTTKNGNKMVGSLTKFLEAVYASDPAVSKYYQEQAYLQRKNWVATNGQDYESPELAEAAYVQNYLQLAKDKVKDNSKESKAYRDSIDKTLTNIKKLSDKNGKLDVDPTDDWFSDLFEEKNMADAIVSHNENQENIVNNTELNNRNISIMAKNIDSLYANEMLGNDLYSSASYYANLTMESTWKPDAVTLKSMDIESREKMHAATLQAKKDVAEIKANFNSTVEAMQNKTNAQKAGYQ
jgi:hypothetical protein